MVRVECNLTSRGQILNRYIQTMAILIWKRGIFSSRIFSTYHKSISQTSSFDLVTIKTRS